MPNAVTVKGRLVSPTTVELLEPVSSPPNGGLVDVVLPAPPAEPGSALRLIEHMMSLPPGRRSREDIDRQIQEERDSWE
jgi:hypothetical protein